MSKVQLTKYNTSVNKNQPQKRLKYDMVLRLKKLLLTLKAGEQQVEFARQMLAQLSEFEPHAAFQRFDSDGDGAISSVDILKFLRANKVDEANEADCYGIVRYYSTTKIGRAHV